MTTETKRDPATILRALLASDDAEGPATKFLMHPEREAIERLVAEREEMLSLLREVEWSATVNVIDDAPIEEARACPTCFAIQRTGHAPDCRLAAFLGVGA